ncbi:putative inner membrane protein [Corynebacterium faecale]|uniref:YeeE/YedE thiosulfate transporter family protein n=1 Tax=Corynebacterium faecale TaxID=1758466 RepID=UPI0025B3D5DC|nr:YeeE/YedE thiosulfate transporter family protein [Corynebacterium faecale]WJY93347.1 putative inner membrane protein [Corynebacterium faecale]
MILTGLAVGTALGIVMQRGRFCVTGMLRDIFLQRSWRTFVGLLIVIAVHAVGIAALTSAGVITPTYNNFAPAAVILGGFIFGFGIILSGGCASGTWYRSGEGLVGSWIALATYAISTAAMKDGALSGFTDVMFSWETELTTLPALLGVSIWWFVVPFAALTAYLVRHFRLLEAKRPKIARLGNQPAWKRPLHVYTAGALVGLIGVIAWPLSAAAGRNSGLGITTPTSHTLQYATTGDDSYLNWGVMLVLGILVGSFIAAKASGEFRVRVADASTSVRAVIGGTMMGVGASLAGGCTVGNGMVQTSLFSFQGWIALLFIAIGVGVAAKIFLKPAAVAQQKADATQAYSTEESLDHATPTSAEDRVLPVNTDSAVTPAPLGGVKVATGLISLKPAVSQKLRDLGSGYYALDSLGAVCPFPLIEAKDVMKTLQSGDHLVIDFDCTQATDAIPQWCATDGHEVTDFREVGDASWQITVKKG